MGKPPFDIKWAIIGAAVIIGINTLLVAFMRDSIYPGLAEVMGEAGAAWTFTLLAYVGSFFVGGLIVGWASPGTTLVEPAVASTVAIIINLVLYMRAGGPSGVVDALVAVAVAYGLGLAGAKVGEKLQGDTTDKMRERGEL